MSHPGVLVLILLFVAPAVVAEIAVKGKLVEETGAPINGARIRLLTNSQDIFADASGAFYGRLAAAGEYRITAWRDGSFTLENYPVDILPERELVIVLNHKREIIESVKVSAAVCKLAPSDHRVRGPLRLEGSPSAQISAGNGPIYKAPVQRTCTSDVAAGYRHGGYCRGHALGPNNWNLPFSERAKGPFNSEYWSKT